MMELLHSLLLIFDATLRVSTPLLLAALAGLYSERAGVVDIGLEGKLLASAFAAAACAAVTGSAWSGLLAGVAVSVGLALLHGFACINHRSDQVVSGVAINMLAVGMTATLGSYWFNLGGQTPNLSGEARFAPIAWFGAEEFLEVPLLGPLYAEVLSGHNILVYLAFAMVPLSWWVIFRTRYGLSLRAVGENPAAVDTAGMSVTEIRYGAVMICGVLCGIAGSYLSIAHNAGFIPNMSAGKGFIALAALIFGKWRPIPVMLACLLFGFLDALAVRLQGVDLPIIGQVPVQFIEMLPYALTVFLLAGFIGKATAPKAIGKPYIK